jgi:hypothetical protein
MLYFVPLIVLVGILAWMLRPIEGLSKAGRNSILLVTISSLVLALVSVIVQLVQNANGNTDLSDISNILFIIGVSIVIAVIVLITFFAIKHKGEFVRALSFGDCISVIICLTELFVLGWLAGDF